MKQTRLCLGLLLLALPAIAAASTLSPSHRRALVAIRNGDLTDLRAELDAGLDPDTKDAKGLPLLARCVDDNQAQMVAILVRRGADLAWRHPETRNGLGHLCVLWERPRVLDALLAAGMDPDLSGGRDKDKEPIEGSPLTLAAVQDEIEMVRILIRRGADLNFVDGLGGTPTSRAWEFDHEEIARLLERYGATDDAKVAKDDPLRVGTRAQPPQVASRSGGRAPAAGLFGLAGLPSGPAMGRRPVFEVTAATVLGGPLSGLWAAFSARHADWGLNANGHITRLEGGVTMQSSRRIDALPTDWARELYEIGVDQGHVPANPGAPFLVAPQGGAAIVAAQEEQRLQSLARAEAEPEAGSESQTRPVVD